MLPGGVFASKYETDMAIVRTPAQWAALLLAVALVLAVPLFASSYWLSWLTSVATVIIAVLGLHVLTGLCGQVSLGHSAFMGVGAYAAAILATRYGVNGWLCLPASCLAAGLAGLVFGLPSFRLKGLYLAISTLAASYIIGWCMTHYMSVTGGTVGLPLQPLRLGAIDFMDRTPFYILTMVILMAATLGAKNLQRTATGRAFLAIRDNEAAAEANGIAVFKYKMLAFFIACCYSGVAGWLYAYANLRITPGAFNIGESMWWLGMLIIGGMGTTTGVFLGVGVISGLKMVFSNFVNPWVAGLLPPASAQQVYLALSLVGLGMLILVFMVHEPRGLYARWEKVKTWLRLYPYAGYYE